MMRSFAHKSIIDQAVASKRFNFPPIRLAPSRNPVAQLHFGRNFQPQYEEKQSKAREYAT
jgi:hypothetical protein